MMTTHFSSEVAQGEFYEPNLKRICAEHDLSVYTNASNGTEHHNPKDILTRIAAARLARLRRTRTAKFSNFERVNSLGLVSPAMCKASPSAHSTARMRPTTRPRTPHNPPERDTSTDSHSDSGTEHEVSTDNEEGSEEVRFETRDIELVLLRYAYHVHETFFPGPGFPNALPEAVVDQYKTLFGRIEDLPCRLAWESLDDLKRERNTIKALAIEFFDLCDPLMDAVVRKRNDARFQSKTTTAWLETTNDYTQDMLRVTNE